MPNTDMRNRIYAIAAIYIKERRRRRIKNGWKIGFGCVRVLHEFVSEWYPKSFINSNERVKYKKHTMY